MKRINSTAIFFLAFVSFCFCWALVFGDAMSDKKEERTNLFQHYYIIKPESLLETLETDKSNAFFPTDEEPSVVPITQQISVTWTQNDYFRIVNALFNFLWSDTDELINWQLNSMDFALTCEKVGIGLQDGNFRLFKYIKEGKNESRIVRIINIDPRNNVVFITENKYYPILADWSAIDMGENLLPAEEILQIAENAGGQEKRLSVKNACNISLWLYPDSGRYNGWTVSYSRRDDGTTFFQVEIDPITGEIH